MLDMNEEIRSQWTAALRSGKYSQGRYVLNRNGRYCCLGVLCDLADEAGVITEVTTSDTGMVSYDARRSMLPQSVMDWAGLEFDLPAALVDGGLVCLSSENDKSTPFSKIADYIDH